MSSDADSQARRKGARTPCRVHFIRFFFREKMIAISHRPGTLPADFYVYIHRKATTGEVFYVGKGQKNRAWVVHVARSKRWLNTARKHGVVVEIFISGLQEWAAHEIEIEQIALHGRRDLGYGTLCNMTDGGEGCTGLVVSEEARTKSSAAKKGLKQVPWSDGKREKCLRSFNTDERKASRASAMKTAWQDPESKTRRALAISATKKKNGPSDLFLKRIAEVNSRPVKCECNGMTFGSMTAAREWLKRIGNTKASNSSIHAAINGRTHSAYGFKWSYL